MTEELKDVRGNTIFAGSTVAYAGHTKSGRSVLRVGVVTEIRTTSTSKLLLGDAVSNKTNLLVKIRGDRRYHWVKSADRMIVVG